MRKQGLVITSILLSLLSGCGSDANSAPAKTTPAPQGEFLPISSTALTGTWTASCRKNPKHPTVYINENITFDFGEVTRTTTTYADSTCSKYELYRQTLVSKYTISDAGIYHENRNLLYVLPSSSAAVSMFRQGSFCGDQAWVESQERSFKDPSVCDGIRTDLDLGLKIRKQRGVSELSVRECAVRNNRDCTTMTYLQAN